MKRLVLFCLVAALLLPMAACAPASQSAGIVISCDEFGNQNKIARTLNVTAGSTFSFTLCTNPSTGFTWEDARFTDATSLQQISRKTQAGQANKPGSPAQETWTFKALKQGTNTINLAYSRPWQGGEKGVWTFTLTVAAK